jgi:hypothetical protein
MLQASRPPKAKGLFAAAESLGSALEGLGKTAEPSKE